MCSSLTKPLLFVVQSFLVGAWLLPQHDASTVPVLQVQLVPPAPIIDEPCFRHQPDLETTLKPFLDKQVSSTWSTLDTDYLKDGHRTPAFSGHEGAAGMCSSLIKPLLFVVQVSEIPSLYCKRSSNVCLLLFPCPSVFCEIIYECVLVSKQLLLCGDVKTNPGPNSEVLAAITNLSTKLESRHADVLQQFADLKKNQEKLTRTVSELATWMDALESVVDTLDRGPSAADITNIVSAAVQSKKCGIEVKDSRMDKLEDRSRRDNLIFYGIADNETKTWEQSEAHVCNLAPQLEMQSSELSGSISRAHRLGVFSATKMRPIIVKFSSSKARDRILSRKAKLKSSGVPVGRTFAEPLDSRVRS
ncbi:hypothetical protein HPB51_004166 [Rhipicephalus microplus]|uniref:Uncharacterized protein n=1 Tax=Rhipicephalus microplus TaxID=6941 RepID=A0A9J6D3Z0_RHIMP|nr:hypothetical protein HPB51_004166 [Rhipicephalus microplus]